MPFSFGEIYYIQFDPSVGHEYKGRRPGMVIQEENISKTSTLVTVVPFTSQLNQLMPSDVLIVKDELNKLTADSVIKTCNIQSFDKSRLLHRIGRAGSPVVRQVRGYLRRHFGL